MNTDTRELISPEAFKAMEDHGRRGLFTPVPDELADDAQEYLDGRSSVIVKPDTVSGRALSKWATNDQRRRKRKAARASRKKNR